MTFQKVEKVLEIRPNRKRMGLVAGRRSGPGAGAARVLGAGMLVCVHGARRRHGVQSSVR